MSDLPAADEALNVSLSSPALSFQPPGQPPDRLPGQLSRNIPPASQPPDQPPNRLAIQLPDQPAIRLSIQPASQPPDSNLSRSQIKVLAFLYGLPNRFTNRPAIQAATGLRYGTLSDAILVLKRKGYLKTKFEKVSEVSGFSFELNMLLCEQISFLGQPPDRPPAQPPGWLPDQLPDHSSSSFSSFVKTTTTNRPPEQPPGRPPETSIEAILAILDSDPELEYWLSKGITPYQIRSWLSETSTELEILVASLHHAAFQLNDLAEEKSRNIKKVLDYFYSIYRKNRFWPKLPGYKSHRQKEIEFKEAVQKQKEDEERRLAQLAIDEEFEAIMNDPEGETYRRFEAMLKPYERGKSDDSPIRRAAMRNLFNKFIVESESVE